MKAEITEARLARLKRGHIITDTKVAGFAARKRASGRIFFQVRYRLHGKTQAMQLGEYLSMDARLDLEKQREREAVDTLMNTPAGELDETYLALEEKPLEIPEGFLTIVEARKAAADAIAEAARGRNPKLQTGPAGYKLSGALELHTNRLKALGRSPRTIARYKGDIERHLGDWLDRPLSTITRAEVRKRHEKIADKVGPAAANDTFRAFRAIWNSARRDDENLGEAPTISIDWRKTERPEDALLPGDFPAFAKKLKKHSPLIRDYYTLLLYTGLRRRSAAELRWSDVDLKAKTMRIRKPKGGTKRAFTLPLPDTLVDMLQRRRKEAPDSVYVFESRSRDGKKRQPLMEPKKKDLPSPHALRRTFIHVCESYVELPILATKLLVNHAIPARDVTLAYTRADDVEALRTSMNKVAAFIDDALAGKVAGVSKLPRAEQASAEATAS